MALCTRGARTRGRVDETEAALARLRIVRIDQFSEGVGFTADAFDQVIVFLGVVTLRLEFIPEALDDGQALTGLV